MESVSLVWTEQTINFKYNWLKHVAATFQFHWPSIRIVIKYLPSIFALVDLWNGYIFYVVNVFERVRLKAHVTLVSFSLIRLSNGRWGDIIFSSFPCESCDEMLSPRNQSSRQSWDSFRKYWNQLNHVPHTSNIYHIGTIYCFAHV